MGEKTFSAKKADNLFPVEDRSNFYRGKANKRCRGCVCMHGAAGQFLLQHVCIYGIHHLLP